MDLFFRVQGAWTRRDLSSVRDVLAPEMRGALERDLAGLKRDGHINRLENIAVRSAEIEEAWVESGSPFVTVHFVASLLDYTVEERPGTLVSGSARSR